MAKVSFFIIVFSLNCFAWGPTGHRTVAEIAQRHLTPSARTKLTQILGGYTLADVANWPDEIRNIPKFNDFAPLHFADILDQYKTYQDAPAAPGGDVVTAIIALTNFLRTSDIKEVNSIQALSKIDVAMAVKLLVHFVGDVHQPLHVIETTSKSGQRSLGGNRVIVNWMNKWQSNLHSIWDDEMVDHERLSYTEYARFLDHVTPSDVTTWTKTPIVDWANESLSYRKQVYTFPDKQPQTDSEMGFSTPVNISYGYVGATREILRKRLLQGGIRLAGLLNILF